MYLKCLLTAICVMAVSYVYAQVEVVDRSPVGASSPSSAAMPPPPQPVVTSSAAQSGELYYQLQILQQEVLQLRGMMEQQAHELKRLKQQRLDDYLDVDRRLSALGQGGKPVSNGAAVNVTANTAGASTSVAPEDEIQHYRAAIDLVLKKQRYDDAIVELKKHLDVYPRGRYAANATYWLGEIYLLKDDLEQSRQWFNQLLTDYPSHRKAPDGKFKLAKVYHLLGDKEQAEILLKEVATSNTSAASLAKSYLREHYSS